MAARRPRGWGRAWLRSTGNSAWFPRHKADGQWRRKDTETLIGKRIVVLGAGDLAVNLAARLAPFETDVTLVGQRARAGVVAISDVDALLPDADVVVAMLPGNESTRH